jgi:hypothetical protein
MRFAVSMVNCIAGGGIGFMVSRAFGPWYALLAVTALAVVALTNFFDGMHRRWS